MSDVYSDFLDQMEEKEDYEGSGGVGIVREIKIETGWHAFEAGHDFWKYWRPFNSKSEMKPAFFSSKEAMELDGSSKSPRKAIKLTIYPDDDTKSEMRDLYAVWMTDTYATISKSLRENNLPLNQKFWGRVSYVPDPNAVAKGEEGKTESYKGNAIFPNIRVPVQAFKDKQEAMTFAEANPKPEFDSSNSEYSDKAMANFQNSKTLEDNQKDIFADVKTAYEGKDLLAAQNKGLKLPVKPIGGNSNSEIMYQNAILEYVAETWDTEAGDIVILPVSNEIDMFTGQEVPF